MGSSADRRFLYHLCQGFSQHSRLGGINQMFLKSFQMPAKITYFILVKKLFWGDLDIEKNL